MNTAVGTLPLKTSSASGRSGERIGSPPANITSLNPASRISRATRSTSAVVSPFLPFCESMSQYVQWLGHAPVNIHMA